jgi:hypothetical protein
MGDGEPASARVPMLLTIRNVEAELQLGRTRTYELLMTWLPEWLREHHRAGTRVTFWYPIWYADRGRSTGSTRLEGGTACDPVLVCAKPC